MRPWSDAISILFTIVVTIQIFPQELFKSTGYIRNQTRHPSQRNAESTVRIDSGLSIRNHQKGHYYPMFDWDNGEYAEFAWWDETGKGSIVHFMNFRIAFPPDFDKIDPNKRYPAIVMLHGRGESGRKSDGDFNYDPSDPWYDNNSHQLEHAGRNHLKAMNKSAADDRAFPGIVIMPQVSYNAAWSNENVFILGDFLEWMIREYKIDPDRIVIHGLSNGARGVWKLVAVRADLFAAALPMSGVGNDIDSMTDVLDTKPIWMFQGDQDSNPSPDYSKRWYNELVKKGGTPRYTLYENTGHGTWWEAYKEPDFFSWIRSKNIKNIHVMGGDPRENPCEDPVEGSLELGFSAGFLQYQWVRNGQEIPGATHRHFTARKEGLYFVKFQRKTDSTWDESFVMDVHYGKSNLPDLVPSLEAKGSTSLPSFKKDKSLVLKAEPAFSSYEWYKDGTLLEAFRNEELILNNSEGDLFQVQDTGTYRVKAVDGCGYTSRLSASVRVTYDSLRKLSTVNVERANLKVYPNPFREKVTIEFPDDSFIPEQLTIYDPFGRNVITDRLSYRLSNRNITLDLSGLRPGIYILSIGDQQIKLVKTTASY